MGLMRTRLWLIAGGSSNTTATIQSYSFHQAGYTPPLQGLIQSLQHVCLTRERARVHHFVDSQSHRGV